MDERIKIQFMNLNTDLLQEKFGKSLIIKENLSKYSLFNLGGPADIFFRPQQLLFCLAYRSQQFQLKFF